MIEHGLAKLHLFINGYYPFSFEPLTLLASAVFVLPAALVIQRSRRLNQARGLVPAHPRPTAAPVTTAQTAPRPENLLAACGLGMIVVTLCAAALGVSLMIAFVLLQR